MIDRIWSGKSPLYLVLLPLAWFYGLIANLIRYSYKAGLKKAGGPRCPLWWSVT